MAGVGLSDGRALQALESVRRHLDTEYGILLLQPAYTRYCLLYTSPLAARYTEDELFKMIFVIIEMLGSVCYSSIIEGKPDTGLLYTSRCV